MEKSCIWNFKPVINERKLPTSWKKFCEMFPIKKGECYISEISTIIKRDDNLNRLPDCDKAGLPDRATAEAVLALCQLVQMRNAFNGDWKPSWTDDTDKYIIGFLKGHIETGSAAATASILYFKTKELRDEFLRNFHPLIEKLKPLYGII